MTDHPNTLFVAHESGREDYYTLVGTPEALRKLSDALLASLSTLPSPLESARDLRLGGLVVGDAADSRRETYLSIRAEPSLEWLSSRRQRKTRRDWFVTFLLVAASGFAIFGFGTFVRWLLAHVI
jgi:hypothetical protein